MLEPRTTVLATCAPFLPGYGFRAELHHVALPSGRDVYRLYSWDAAIIREDGPATMEGPTLRAECSVSDYRPGADGDKSDAHLAMVLCQFWAHFSQSEDRDPESVERVNAGWWDRWDGTGGGLTGEDDDGNPDTWTCDDYQPPQD